MEHAGVDTIEAYYLRPKLKAARTNKMHVYWCVVILSIRRGSPRSVKMSTQGRVVSEVLAVRYVSARFRRPVGGTRSNPRVGLIDV